MELDEVTAYARERLGMEIQAATLLGAQPAWGRRLEGWSLMTERGWFWLVEEGSAVELFRGAPGGARSVGLAVRQFLGLHPDGPEARAPAANPTAGHTTRLDAERVRLPRVRDSGRSPSAECDGRPSALPSLPPRRVRARALPR